MLLFLQNQGLTLSISDPVYKLITSIPDFASNSVGATARKALANKLKGALPGSHSALTLFGHAGPPFRDIFYPSYRSVPYESGITTGLKSLSAQFWSDFSIAVLCESIKHQTSSAKNMVNRDKVNSDISRYNQSVTDEVVTWYSYVLFHDFMDYKGDLNCARKVYIEQLKSDHWVTFKTAQYTNGYWYNPDWELFHHWAKLSALGASDGEIDSLIKSLQDKGLPVPSDVGPGKWRSYLVWYSPNTLNHNDVDAEAKAGELMSRYLPSPWPQAPVTEENSYSFIAHGQPGTKYWGSPPSSCLSYNTSVLMSDDTSRPIKDVQVGDTVKTPSGTSKVLMISTPKMGTRYVYRINKLPFYFTEAHPFLSYSGSPRYLAVSPLRLLRNVPLLGQDGVGQMQEGTELLAHDGSKITVTSLEKITPEETDDCVCDLIIEPSVDGKFEYYAGSGKSDFFTVASEISTTSNHSTAEKLAFEVILNVIQANTEKLETLYTSFSRHEDFLQRIQEMARLIKGNFLSSALSIDPPESNSLRIIDMPLAELIVHATGALQSKPGEYSQALGAAYDYFMQCLFHPIASALELGHRVVPESNSLEYLVVSVMGFGVVHAGPKIPATPIIRVHTPRQEMVNEEGEEQEDQVYTRRFHKSYYFAVKTSDENFDVIIELFGSDGSDGGKCVLLRASLFVEVSLQHGCINWRLPFFDKNRIEQGYVDVESRFLTARQLDLELTQAANWDETSQKDLAASIEKVCEDYLGYLCEITLGNSLK